MKKNSSNKIPLDICFGRKFNINNYFYVLEDGTVQFLVNNASVRLGHTGCSFGELALLDEEPRSATAIAKSPSKLIGFFRTDLLTLMSRDPKLGNKIMMDLSRVLGERLRQTNKELTKML